VCRQIWQFTVQCKYSSIKIYCLGCTFKTFLTQVPKLHDSPAAQSHKLRYTLVRLTLSPLGYVTVVLTGVLFGRQVSPSPITSKHVEMLYWSPPVTCEKKIWFVKPKSEYNLVTSLTFILLMWRIGWAPNSIPVYCISNKMQRYTVYLYLETDPHVSGGTSTHHQ
jgi:hypothetical protein